MLLTIHNLPAHMQYPDIKQLLFTKCGLTELIVDNLVNEGNSKKVTIGVTDDSDAAIVVRKINGLFLSGQQLYVEDVRYKLESDQPYRPQVSPKMTPNRFGAPEKQSFGISGNQRYEPENQRFGASNQRQFDTSDSHSFGGPKSQRLSAPKQQRFGAPENQKFSAPDSQSFGGPKSQRLSAPKQQRFGAPENHKFSAPDSQSFGGPKSQRLSASKQQRFGAPENQKFSAPDSQSFGVPKSQRLGAPKQRFGATDDQKFSATDSQSFGSPKNKRYGALENQRLGAPTQSRFGAPEIRNFGAPDNQRFDSPKDQWFGASSNQMVVAPDNQQFGVPAVPFVAEQGFLAPGFMQMPMNMPMMPNMPLSSMNIQPGAMIPGNPYVATFIPQGQDQNFMGFQPNNPVGWGDNQHQPTGPGLPEPFEEPEPSNYDLDNRDYSSNWDNPGIEDEMPMDRDIQRNSSRPRMPENISRSPRHGYGGPPNTDYDREYYRAERKPAPPIKSYNQGRDTDGRGRGSNRTDRRPRVEARGRGEGIRRDRSPRGRQDSTRFDRTETRGDSRRFDDRRPNRYDERPRERPRTETRRPDLKRKSSEPVAKRPPKREQKLALMMEDTVLWTNKMNNREESYRGMATAEIAKEVGKKYAVPFVTPTQLKMLKAAIRKRIDLLLGTDYHDTPAEVTEIYRKKYPMNGDEKLFRTTMEELQKTMASASREPLEFAANGDKLVKDSEGHTSATRVVKKTNIPGIPVLKKPKLEEGAVLPSYPNASKKVYNQLKTIQKTEKSDTYEIDDLTNTVMDEELTAIVEAIQLDLPEPTDDADILVYNHIKEKIFEEYVQVLKLTCIKRIRNIKTNLLLRAFGAPKLPNRTSMTNYLKNYSVLSLKSSVKGKFYVITLDSYEDYDTLLSLENPTIDGMPVQFKTMHLTGPKEKLDKKKYKKAKTNFVKQQVQEYYGAVKKNEQQDDDIEETEPNPNDETFPDFEPNLDDEPMFDDYTMNDTVDEIPEDLLNVNEDELEDY